MIIRVGILGESEGNGHPYSWSAICNGYSKTEILNCNYPEIIHYLSKEKWPESKIKGVRITHIFGHKTYKFLIKLLRLLLYKMLFNTLVK